MKAWSIRLEGLAFRAYHGVYEQERENGNDFIVDIELCANVSAAAVSDSLQDTADYALVYTIAQREMNKRKNLLESLAQAIADSILNEMPVVDKVTISVSKLNPPIGSTCPSAKVTLTQSRQ